MSRSGRTRLSIVPSSLTAIFPCTTGSHIRQASGRVESHLVCPHSSMLRTRPVSPGALIAIRSAVPRVELVATKKTLTIVACQDHHAGKRQRSALWQVPVQQRWPRSARKACRSGGPVGPVDQIADESRPGPGYDPLLNDRPPSATGRRWQRRRSPRSVLITGDARYAPVAAQIGSARIPRFAAHPMTKVPAIRTAPPAGPGYLCTAAGAVNVRICR